jgi:hypothetical protein
MVEAALLSQLRPNKALLHKHTKRTRRMVRTTIPWGCRIANLQRRKRNSLRRSTNKNTQESKCTFRSTKPKRPRRGQSESRPSAIQSDKDKKHTQPYKGAITMKNNFWTLLVAAYAHQDTRPWEECGQSRQRKDGISRGGEEAVASDQVKTIDIRATVYETSGIRKGGESRTSHGQTKRTRRMVRTTIPWDCRIANLQRLKQNSLKKSTNKNTQESKCTFRSTKPKSPRQGQSEPTTMVAAYAHPDTRPWEECGQSRQRKDAISRGGEEAVASDQVKTIDIRATVYEASKTRKGGESRTSHGEPVTLQ